MRAMTLELLHIPLARDADHKPEVSIRAGLHSGNGILDDNRPFRLDPEKSCRHQIRIRRWFSGESFRFDDVAIHPHLEEIIQLGGFEHGRAVLTRRHHGDLESVAAELMNESHAPVVRLYSF